MDGGVRGCSSRGAFGEGGGLGPTELGGLVHGPSWEIERGEWLLECVSAAVGDGEGVASFCKDVHHGLEDLLDPGYDEACLVVGIILRDLHDPGGL